MNTTDAASPRARLVEGLWQLKQVCEQQDDQGLRHMHFNTLMKDPDYRLEIIRRASSSRNPKIRALAQQLDSLDSRDVLIAKHNGASRGAAIINPDIAATRERLTTTTPTRGWRLPVLGLVVLALVATGLWLFRDDLTPGARQQVVSGSLFGEHYWGADREWLLADIVYLEAGASLVIEPGTRILGQNGSALVVTRDATIHARGTATAPIVFTSATPVGTRASGDWGGLVLLGNAPVNLADARIEGVPVGDTRAAFGGVDVNANCGVLEYVRVEFAGFEVYANNELNGLTLGGCGSHTIVRNVQVHRALDDGVEVFGGTVDLKQVVITGAADDSLDWDMGWRGRVQFLVVQHYPGVGDNAFEGDNRASNPRAEPVSEPVFYNVTLLGGDSSESYQRVMTLRQGTGGHFHNVLMRGFSGELIDIRDEVTVQRLDSGQLQFGQLLAERIGDGGNNFFSDESGSRDDDGGFDEAAYFAELGLLSGQNTGLGAGAHSLTAPDYVPRLRAGGPQSGALPQGEFWDEAAAYLGAIRPGIQRSWLDGWTAFPEH